MSGFYHGGLLLACFFKDKNCLLIPLLFGKSGFFTLEIFFGAFYITKYNSKPKDAQLFNQR